MADTLQITDMESRKKTQHDIDKIGRHIVTDLKVKKWTKQEDNVLRYIQALVAVSPPEIIAPGSHHEFDGDLTSDALLDLKRS